MKLRKLLDQVILRKIATTQYSLIVYKETIYTILNVL